MWPTLLGKTLLLLGLGPKFNLSCSIKKTTCVTQKKPGECRVNNYDNNNKLCPHKEDFYLSIYFYFIYLGQQ